MGGEGERLRWSRMVAIRNKAQTLRVLAAPQAKACGSHGQCYGSPEGMAVEDELSPGGVELGPFSPDSSLSVFFLAQETFCLLV